MLLEPTTAMSGHLSLNAYYSCSFISHDPSHLYVFESFKSSLVLSEENDRKDMYRKSIKLYQVSCAIHIRKQIVIFISRQLQGWESKILEVKEYMITIPQRQGINVSLHLNVPCK